jgi:galactofuranosylgalactofuranosylrhamnosyl-N-acetylglucosaminyl-diphospho-decaprenol beta-1,5/1,6-galactofuranosyltransferase
VTGRRHSGTLQRVVFPTLSNDHARDLYVRALVGDVAWERSALILGSATRASLATYFAAFPAAVWARWAGVSAVRLIGNASGPVRLRIFTRDSAGVRSEDGWEDAGAFSRRIDLLPDDQWCWVEVETGDAPVVVEHLAWESEEADRGSTTVCVTTHNRPTDCVGVLKSLATETALLDVVHEVLVIDQGSSRVSDAAGYAEVAAKLGPRLRVIEQANLGGSGGFSRGMLEAERTGSEYVVLLDDDVQLEPESMLRMIAMASRAAEPTLVGAHMLDLNRPTRLHSWGEQVTRPGFGWRSAQPLLDGSDLAKIDVTSVDLRTDVDFNGWWMCLVPTEVIRRVGAAMPFFIKWDDTEFALRAATAGSPTVTLPGAALWHVSWEGKDDGLDWQAYFQLRNRVVTALLHAGQSRPDGLLRSTLAQDVNHVLCMQYGSAAARRQALTDVLSGPRHLDATLARRAADIRALMDRAGQSLLDDYAVSPEAPRGVGTNAPAGAAKIFARFVRSVAHQLRRSVVVAPVRLERSEGKWWRLGLLDTAAVRSATGSGWFLAQRDRATALVLLVDALRLRWRLRRSWVRLSGEYRRAAADQASAEAWVRRFAGLPGRRQG